MKFVNRNNSKQLHWIVCHKIPAVFLSANAFGVMSRSNAISLLLENHQRGVVDVRVITQCRHKSDVA